MDYDINSISTILFILHLIASGFMLSVIRKQLGLFKKYIDPELRAFRLVLFLLSLSIFLGNLIPLTIDFINAIGVTSNEVPIGRIVYISSNAIVAVISAALIWSMYRMAAKTAVIVEDDKIEALKKKK
jgi:hypothetical protein